MLSFHVPSMTCGGCVRAITRAVAAVDPAARVEADLAARIVRIDAPATGADAYSAALRAAGYPATAGAPAIATRGCGCGCGPRKVLAPEQAPVPAGTGCCA